MRTRAGLGLLAFTLAEMSVAVGCATVVLAAVMAAGVSLQKSYGAVEGYSNAEADQLRVLDYIAMDCRRALSASINTVTVNGVSENALVLTLPPYYSSTTTSAVPNTPSVGSGTLSYGTDKVTITYQQNGSNFSREVKVTDSTGTTVNSDFTTPIAKNVATFTITPSTSDNNNLVVCSIMFFPNFQGMAGTGSWRGGGSTPRSDMGVDGDWYVIDTTATDPTTVGDVYLKAGGAYTKKQNVKATTVALNTFLRTPLARQ